MQLLPIWVLGFILNIFLLYSVFQIYFQSPVVHVSETHEGTIPSGVRRVVFFVADGLRADSFFSNPHLHPRLTKIIHSDASAWGISDTRVPTESRPGHIALFAGLYEDPSAIFTGWKENLVEFDSVFNRSTYSIALGSPDIVLMFANGAGKEKIHAEAYSSDWQDFLSSNSSMLDTWVLDRFKSILRVKKAPTHDKLIIFLHLLGIDNTGHSTKPRSPEYLANIALVDDIVLEVEQLVNDYYGDEQSVFIFTSDHGMTDWGSHGDGSIAETETPFVLWGKGIKGHEDRQVRLKQADFAALISGALNIPFPTNSVGRFPAELWENQEYAYNSLLANFRQIHEIMTKKKSLVTKGILPFSPFEEEDDVHRLARSSYHFAERREYDSAIKSLSEAITLALSGIKYYERYDQSWMLVLTVYSFLVWIILIAFVVINLEKDIKIQLFYGAYHLVDLVLSVVCIRGVLGWSVWRMPYTLAPLYLTRLLRSSLRAENEPDFGGSVKLKTVLGVVVSAVVGIEILVLTFYQREILTLGLILNGLWSMKGKSMSTWKKSLWIASVAMLGIFPNLPAIGKMRDPIFITLGPIVCGLLSTWSLSQYSKTSELDGPKKTEKLTVSLQTLLVFSVSILVHFPDFILTRLVAWISVLLSFTVPILVSSSSFVSLRIQSVFLAIATPFCFLSLTYESLFLPALYVTLFILIKLEVTETRDMWTDFWSLRIQSTTNTKADEDDAGLTNAFRRAWFNIFFIYLSFFGIGNIGSISSFDPSSVRCFVSVFNPFVMMILLLMKIIGPFVLVACFFRLLLHSKLQVERNFLIVLFLCQGMALHMFFNVTNVGSWLEIGTSISHYVIVQATTLVLSILYFGANILTTGTFAFTATSIPVQSASTFKGR